MGVQGSGVGRRGLGHEVQTKASAGGGDEPERWRPGARRAARRLELAGAAVARREERRRGSREKDEEEEEAQCERGARGGERRCNAHARAWRGQRATKRADRGGGGWTRRGGGESPVVGTGLSDSTHSFPGSDEQLLSLSGCQVAAKVAAKWTDLAHFFKVDQIEDVLRTFSLKGRSNSSRLHEEMELAPSPIRLNFKQKMFDIFFLPTLSVS
jgi:hypothetical protein